MINLYHPDILFFMKTKVNSIKAKKLINQLKFSIPFFCRSISYRFFRWFWIVWKNSPDFQFQVLFQESKFVHVLFQEGKFVHSNIKDVFNSTTWLIPFVYGYPHHFMVSN